MSSDARAPISPGNIPGTDLDPDGVAAAALSLSTGGAAIRDGGASVVTEWRKLSVPYSAPEASTLLTVMDDVETESRDFGDAVEAVAAALGTYVETIRPIKTSLASARTDAWGFLADISDKSDWREDQDLIDRNTALLERVNSSQEQLWEAERTCANTISALYGGDAWHAMEAGDDGLGYGYDSLATTDAMPWGTEVQREDSCPKAAGTATKRFVWDGIIVDGIGGTVVGLGMLVGIDGTGVHWETMKQSWQGMGSLIGYADGDWWQGDVAGSAWKEAGKGIVAADMWSQDPARALGSAGFNVATFLVPAAGVAVNSTKVAARAAMTGRTATLAKVGSAVGAANKIIDFTDPLALGINAAKLSADRMGGFFPGPGIAGAELAEALARESDVVADFGMDSSLRSAPGDDLAAGAGLGRVESIEEYLPPGWASEEFTPADAWGADTVTLEQSRELVGAGVGAGARELAPGGTVPDGGAGGGGLAGGGPSMSAATEVLPVSPGAPHGGSLLEGGRGESVSQGSGSSSPTSGSFGGDGALSGSSGSGGHGADGNRPEFSPSGPDGNESTDGAAPPSGEGHLDPHGSGAPLYAVDELGNQHAVRMSSDIIAQQTSYREILDQELAARGMAQKDFVELVTTRLENLSRDEVTTLLEIRDALPPVHPDDIMQKIIDHQQAWKILNGDAELSNALVRFTEEGLRERASATTDWAPENLEGIGGYVSRAADVYGLSSRELYRQLGLDYAGSRFAPNGESMFAVRHAAGDAYAPSRAGAPGPKVDPVVPYGPLDAMKDMPDHLFAIKDDLIRRQKMFEWVELNRPQAAYDAVHTFDVDTADHNRPSVAGRNPKRGNAFSGTGRQYAPELTLGRSKMDVPDGAEMWRIGPDGTEELAAVFRNLEWNPIVQQPMAAS